MTADAGIRTFKPRRRRLSAERASVLERLAPSLTIDADGPQLDLPTVFGRRSGVVLDIGIGHGETLVAAAHADDTRDYIGADVHTPGIAAVLERIEECELGNVRVVHGDALRFTSRLDDGSLVGVHAFFPDPWPKARHQRRRLISPDRLDEFARLIEVGGTLHVATDIDDYASMVQRLAGDHSGFEGGVVPRPSWRPTTRYERKGLDAGRTVTDLVYTRTEAAIRPSSAG